MAAEHAGPYQNDKRQWRDSFSTGSDALDQLDDAEILKK